MTSRVRAAALAAAVAVLAACNDDGRTLADAPEVPASEITASTTSTVPSGVQLTSPTLVDGGTLPPEHTCDGAGTAPTLQFRGPSPGVVELAISVVDEDADGYLHWVVAGLPPTLASLAGAALPSGAVPAATTGGVFGWEPACPPEGDGAHRYSFTVYGMVEPIGLSPGLDGADALAIIEAAAFERDSLTVLHER